MERTRIATIRITVIDDVEKETSVEEELVREMERTLKKLFDVDDVKITDVQDFYIEKGCDNGENEDQEKRPE